jgi:hypothetical protein
VRLTSIFTYHYGYNGAPGKIRILDSSGKQVAVWQATGRDSSDKPSWYWEVTTQTKLQPGTYKIQTSSPSWSQNSGSGGNGMVQIKGVYLNN